jgi:hypothetical protein
MNLGLNTVSSTYQFVLNQSGANTITLGDGSAVNWNAGGVVALTGDQGISGAKTFYSQIVQSNSNGATINPELALRNGTYYNQFLSRSTAGAWNSLVQANDHSFIYSNVTQDDASLVIGPWSSGAKGIRITSAGNIGIGTASPTQTLHVTGSIYANSFTGTSFSGSSFTGNIFSGTTFSGNSFIGNSFALQNTGIKLLSAVSLASANTWYDVTSLSGTLNSGTWLMNAMALYSGAATTGTAAFRVLDSTSGTVYASAMNFHTNSISDLSTTNISTIINLTSTTTVKLQALSSLASANILASGTGLANSGSCSQISFVKIS